MILCIYVLREYVHLGNGNKCKSLRYLKVSLTNCQIMQRYFIRIFINLNPLQKYLLLTVTIFLFTWRRFEHNKSIIRKRTTARCVHIYRYKDTLVSTCLYSFGLAQTGWLDGWLAGWLVGLLPRCLAGWLFRWLAVRSLLIIIIQS